MVWGLKVMTSRFPGNDFPVPGKCCPGFRGVNSRYPGHELLIGQDGVGYEGGDFLVPGK